MEVEVKLHLSDATSHQKLSTLLSPFHTKTLIQENIFFDGINTQLSSKLVVLHLRSYNVDAQCILFLKSYPKISNGISRAENDEEPLDLAIGRDCVTKFWRFGSINSRILKRVMEEFGVGYMGLVCLGGYGNVRAVYDSKVLKLELDETKYDFGISYEIECECEEPERAKKLLEGLLEENGIGY